MLGPVFLLNIFRKDAMSLRTAPKSEHHKNPCDAAYFDDVVWPAFERQMGKKVDVSKICTLDAPKNQSEVE